MNENKIFAIMVEDKIARVMVVSESQKSRYNLYGLNPDIINITHLPYKPAKGSVWNGENFIIPENLLINHEPQNNQTKEKEESFTFAYLVNNTCLGTVNFLSIPAAQELIDLYLTNPNIMEITEMIKELDHNAPPIGWLVKDGKIVKE